MSKAIPPKVLPLIDRPETLATLNEFLPGVAFKTWQFWAYRGDFASHRIGRHRYVELDELGRFVTAKLSAV
jgi:hypothetical protein